MTRADFKAGIEQMHQLVEEARDVVEDVSADDLRAAAIYGLSVSERAIRSWETTQLDEVIAGTRPLQRWVSYGAELVTGLERIIEDAGEVSAQFSRLANWLGDASSALVGPLEARVAELRKRVDELAVQRKAWERDRKDLQDADLTDEARKVLFGADAAAALANMDALGKLVVGLESGVSLLRNGRAKLERTTDGRDVKITPLSGIAYQVLGAVPLVTAAVTLGAVATALAIAVSVKAYFGHANSVARTERTRLALETAERTGADPVKVLEQLNKGDELANEGGLGDAFKTARFFGGLALVGAAGWGGWKLYERIQHDRKQARR